jgi:hypothetical protein
MCSNLCYRGDILIVGGGEKRTLREARLHLR